MNRRHTPIFTLLPINKPGSIEFTTPLSQSSLKLYQRHAFCYQLNTSLIIQQRDGRTNQYSFIDTKNVKQTIEKCITSRALFCQDVLEMVCHLR